ncbi:MAG TPA: signal peptide peptidase SppA [Thiothrix sp.]|nr:signal peptide peptidase SppA [Thiothrix sp.]
MSDSEKNAIKSLETIALASLTEQTRARRWGIFFKVAFLVWGLFMLFALLSGITPQNAKLTATEFTAVVDVKGVIMDGADAGYSSVSQSLQEAFEDERTKGVVLRINSPGGSAVQSAMVYDEIKRLQKQYPNIPVYAVIQDLGASGGYYIAAAADKIYANRSSLVGSIGVRMDSFGVVEAARKLGIESRLVTAGEHKAILDPFQPVSEAEQVHLKKMLASTHKQFINAVKAGRGERLKNNPDIFSGLFWTGEDAQALGLIDGFLTTSQVARDVIKAEETINFTPEKTLLDKLSGQVSMRINQMMQESRLLQGVSY